MTYSAAVAYLYSLQKHGIKLGLETMTTLMSRLGNPQTRYAVVHIAGTNGKGSTAAIAAAILEAAGHRVGLYTSPHLVEFRERIRVNGAMIPEAEVARLTGVVRCASGGDLAATFFESTTAMALQYFADAGVEVAVLEVGLGGRFDATNIAAPRACAITTVALDHQEYLGDTLPAIAFEKAGIIKPQVPVILGRIEGEALEIILNVADERRAPVSRLGTTFTVRGTSDRFCYQSGAVHYDDLSVVLNGTYQLDNAACAIALLQAAGTITPPIGEHAVRTGLASVRWEGRLEEVQRDPTVLLDGAHNPASAGVLAEYLHSIKAARPSSRVTVVLAMMRDKDHRGVARALRAVADHIIFTQVDIARSASAEDLQRELRDIVPVSSVASPASEALALAKRSASPRDIICVTGSLMLVGEVKAALRGCELSPLRG
ncbi:MAG TPA: folylpolyglutamate synthase/dihydrofolate synthase family protein [Nitrospira sp.]|nr:folylpolyglutamate synthase/dihydrofolate synthase family protein [Nitrospira sp.]